MRTAYHTVHSYCVSECGKEGDNSVISDDSKILLILGYLCNGRTHTGQYLMVI